MQTRYAKRTQYVKASEVREMLKLSEKPEIISFGGGLPAPELFPIEQLRKVTDLVLSQLGQQALQYGTTEGYIPLRGQVAERLSKRGVAANAEDIIITSGSQQGLDLTGKVFIDESDAIFCESPTYLSAIGAFKTFMPKFVEIEMDEDGMVMEVLEERIKEYPKAKFIYTIPEYQNPSGRSMSLERRRTLVEIANRYDITVIEDNPYGEIGFEGEALPPVKHFDREGRVVYLGTISKILCPGLRLGWVCASPEILNKYVLFKQGTDLNTNVLSQMIASKYMEMYDIEEHICKIKETYKRRKNLMYNTIKEEFPENVKVTNPNGGLFLWVTLPEGVNSREVLAKSLEQNVAFVPGGSFFPETGKENCMRLNFSNMPEDRIVEGIKRLAGVIKSVL